MRGIVLWSNESNKKAMVWCEDQGDLAYLNVETELMDHDAQVEPGDLLEFDVCNNPQTRLARNARFVSRGHAPQLAKMLDDKAGKPVEARPLTARVIPFREVANCAPRRQRAAAS